MEKKKVYIFIFFAVFIFCIFLYKKKEKEPFTNIMSDSQADRFKAKLKSQNQYIQNVSLPFKPGWRNNIPKNQDLSSMNASTVSGSQNVANNEIYRDESRKRSGKSNSIRKPNTNIHNGLKAGGNFSYGGQNFRSGVSLPPTYKGQGGVIIDGRHVFIEEITYETNDSGSSSDILETYGNSTLKIRIKGHVDPSWNQSQNNMNFGLGIAFLDLANGEYLKMQGPNDQGNGLKYTNFKDTIFSQVTYNHQTFADSHCKRPSDCNEVAGGAQNVERGVTGKWTCSMDKTKTKWKPEGNRYCVGYTGYNRYPTSSVEKCKSYCNADKKCNAIAVGPGCVTYRNCSISDKKQHWGWNYWKKETKEDMTENQSKEDGKCAVQCKTNSDCSESRSGLFPNGNWKCIENTCQAPCRNQSDCERSGLKNHKCQEHIHANSNEAVSGYRQKGYRGSQNKTNSGRTCQNWRCFENGSCKHTGGSLNTVVRNKNNSSWNNKNGIGNHNFCRNPDSSGGGIWCYTNDSNKRWEYCNPLPAIKDKKCEPNHGEKTWINTFGGANWRNLKQPKYSFNYESKPIIIDNSINTRVFFLVFKGGVNDNIQNLDFKRNSHGAGSFVVVQPRYEYRTSSWSKCSHECGLTPGGTMERKITCYDKVTNKEPDKGGACKGLKVPEYSEKCNRKICEIAPEIRNFNVNIGRANIDSLNENNYRSIKGYELGINNTFSVPTEKYHPSLLYIGKTNQQINVTWRVVTKYNSLSEVYIYSPSFDGFLGIDTDKNIKTKNFLKITKAVYRDNKQDKGSVKNDDRDLWRITFYKQNMFPVYVIQHVKTGKYLTWFGKQMNQVNMGKSKFQMGRIDMSKKPKAWTILPMEPDYNKEKEYRNAIKFCLSENRKLCTSKKLDIYKRLTGSINTSWVPITRIERHSQHRAINNCHIWVWIYWLIGWFLTRFTGFGGIWYLRESSRIQRECVTDTTNSHFIQAARSNDSWFHLKDYNRWSVNFNKRASGFYCCPEPIKK